MEGGEGGKAKSSVKIAGIRIGVGGLTRQTGRSTDAYTNGGSPSRTMTKYYMLSSAHYALICVM